MTLTEQVNAAIAQLSSDINNNRLELPSPPDMLLKVRALTHDQKTRSEDFANLIKCDPNISGRIIKIANSVLFGSRFHVNSVQSAVSRLGFFKVQNLITGLLITQNFMSLKTQGLEKYFNQSWQQSINVAAISCALAHKKTSIDPEEALLAGMMHNIGVFPILLRLHRIPAFNDDLKLLIHVANQIIPKLYPKAGKMILDNWNFSTDISFVALNHNKLDREFTGPIDLNDIVLIAYQLNKLVDFTDNPHIPDKTLISSITFQKFWANWEDASAEFSTLKDQVEHIKNSIEI